MKRTTYKGYVIDIDNLGRQYIYNTNSPYSEDSDKIVIGTNYSLKDIKSAIDKTIDVGYWVGINSPSWGGYREGSGRPSTGRKKRQLYITDEEYEKVKEYIEQLRSTPPDESR